MADGTPLYPKSPPPPPGLALPNVVRDEQEVEIAAPAYVHTRIEDLDDVGGEDVQTRYEVEETQFEGAVTRCEVVLTR